MAQSVANRKASNSSRMLKVTSRIVNVRRHTTGYIVGGQQYSVSQTLQMAKAGKISGVQVVGDHIQAQRGARKLSDLPTRIERRSV